MLNYRESLVVLSVNATLIALIESKFLSVLWLDIAGLLVGLYIVYYLLQYVNSKNWVGLAWWLCLVAVVIIAIVAGSICLCLEHIKLLPYQADTVVTADVSWNLLQFRWLWLDMYQLYTHVAVGWLLGLIVLTNRESRFKLFMVMTSWVYMSIVLLVLSLIDLHSQDYISFSNWLATVKPAEILPVVEITELLLWLLLCYCVVVVGMCISCGRDYLGKLVCLFVLTLVFGMSLLYFYDLILVAHENLVTLSIHPASLGLTIGKA